MESTSNPTHPMENISKPAYTMGSSSKPAYTMECSSKPVYTMEDSLKPIVEDSLATTIDTTVRKVSTLSLSYSFSKGSDDSSTELSLVASSGTESGPEEVANPTTNITLTTTDARPEACARPDPTLEGQDNSGNNQNSNSSNNININSNKPPSPSASTSSSSRKATVMETFVQGVIAGPRNLLLDVVACHCCQVTLDSETSQNTVNEPTRIARARGSLLGSHGSDDEDEEDPEDDVRDYRHQNHSHQHNHQTQQQQPSSPQSPQNQDEDMLPGILGIGVQYQPRSVLVEGWLHKKGTGNDFWGSRSWKARWARLVTARVHGFECDVPLLQIFWHPSAPVPSTVILLESTVVIPIDRPSPTKPQQGQGQQSQIQQKTSGDDKGFNSDNDKDGWMEHQFEIRHAATRENVTLSVTRTFAAARKARDAWVYAISEALLEYEKEKDAIKKAAVWDSIETSGCIRSIPLHKQQPQLLLLQQQQQQPNNNKNNQPATPVFDEVWTGDRFVTVEVRRPVTPPPSSSPKSSSGPSGRFPDGTVSNSSPPCSPRLPRPKMRRPLARRPGVTTTTTTTTTAEGVEATTTTTTPSTPLPPTTPFPPTTPVPPTTPLPANTPLTPTTPLPPSSGNQVGQS